ncbi:hypothetical protein [Ferrimonas futtsuensis]|uniref:hypothetical protein n=1 Tax=Ferrimonas futtsuensis TaxID=364764 RepID=UPI000480936A|nr:hypothetical protein [Ferrimonas futtsuensis]
MRRLFLIGLLAAATALGAQAKQLQPHVAYGWDDKIDNQKDHPEYSVAILAPAIFTNPRAETYKVHQGRFWQCATRDENGQCTHVKFVGYTAEAEQTMASNEIPMSREEYRRTKELIEQMMMELRFRGLEDSHPMIQQALKQGKAMHMRLLTQEQE